MTEDFESLLSQSLTTDLSSEIGNIMQNIDFNFPYKKETRLEHLEESMGGIQSQVDYINSAQLIA